VGATRLPARLAQGLEAKLPARVFGVVQAVVLLAILFVCLSFLVADSYNPFLYFRF
jgi:hypothetical protein